MVFKGKREATVRRALSGALIVFLVAIGGIFIPAHSFLRLPMEMALAANPAADGACQVVFEASQKLFSTPYHMYSDTRFGNGRTIAGEAVFAGGAMYVLYNGTWMPSPLSMEEMKAKEQENQRNAKNKSCQVVRDEAVNGESATLYSVHDETSRAKGDHEIWISKSRGLILRQETDLTSNTGDRKTHLSVRYEYNHVQAPKL